MALERYSTGGGPDSVYGWNDTATEYPDQQPLAELFRLQARRSPGAVAIISGQRTITYGEVDRWSDVIAGRLIAAGVHTGEPVGLLGDRCLEAPVAMLAILKAGAAYVPLDPADPPGRLRTLVGELDIRRVVMLPGCASVPGRAVGISIDDLRSAPGGTRLGANLRSVRTSGDDRAYIMFTSGSSGPPKAVAVPQRAVTRLVINTNFIRLTADDRIAGASRLAFDASVFEIWGALLNGGRLVVVDADTLADPDRIGQLLCSARISVLFLSTGVFHQLSRVRPAVFSGLRYLLTGGDVLVPDVIRQVLRHGPPRHLLHMYGPTENTTFSTAHEVCDVPAGVVRVPIGRPIANSTCYLMAPDGCQADIGEEGELVVGGDGVAEGYVNSRELTAERFIPDPFGRRPGATLFRTGDLARRLPDGSIEFIGRRDRMVKVHDFRVELDEVEATLAGCPAIGAVAVTLVGVDPVARDIVAFFTPAPDRLDQPPTEDELRDYLAARLPAFMLPSQYLPIERLPLGETGKVDRAALSRLAADQADGVLPAVARTAVRRPPETATEIALARLWTELLDVAEVGLDDSFFDLGGGSLPAIRFVARSQALLRVGPGRSRWLLRRMLADPTLSGCALALEEARAGTRASSDSAVGAAPVGAAPAASAVAFGAVAASAVAVGAAPTVDLWAAARLDVPVNVASSGQPRAGGGPRAVPREILLTGGTGFLGCYLLRELLNTTSARIHCLIRARDPDQAMRRLVGSQSRYALGDIPFGRVTPVLGDLGRPWLGLDEREFDRYAATLDLILHAGAQVNLSYPYEQLAPVTVGGTRELIRLAGRYHGVPLHVVSAFSVLASWDQPERLDFGYAETKWVAERMLRQAAGAGLAVGLYQPYEIAGDLRHGMWNLESATCAWLRVLADTGCAPAVDLLVDLVPVDVLARQVTRIALARPATSATYQLANPRPARLGLLVERLAALGYPIRTVPFDEWISTVVAYCALHPEHPFTPFVPLWSERGPDGGLVVRQRYDRSRLPPLDPDPAVAALTEPGHTVPEVTADLLDHYLRALRHSGFLLPS